VLEIIIWDQIVLLGTTDGKKTAVWDGSQKPRCRTTYFCENVYWKREWRPKKGLRNQEGKFKEAPWCLGVASVDSWVIQSWHPFCKESFWFLIVCYVPWVAKQGWKTPAPSSNFQNEDFQQNGMYTKLRTFGQLCSFLRKQQQKPTWKIFAYALGYFSDYTPLLDACLPHLLH